VVNESTNSTTTTLFFRNSHNISNGARYRKGSMADVQPCASKPSDVVLTNNRTSSNFLDILYGLVQLKHVTWIFKIHKMFDCKNTKERTKIYKMINKNTACSLFLKNVCLGFSIKIQKYSN